MAYDAKYDIGRYDLSYYDVIYGTYGAGDAYVNWLRTYRRKKKKPLKALTELLKHYARTRQN